jgi:hypothetical protein
MSSKRTKVRKSVSTRRASKAGGSPTGRKSFSSAKGGGGNPSLDAPDLFKEHCGMEGYLEKKSTKGKWQKRYFVSSMACLTCLLLLTGACVM